MAMDFVKGCTTNVQSLAGIQKTTIRQYTRNTAFAEPDGVLDTIAFLRRHNVLCTACHDRSSDNGIWVLLPASQTELPAEVTDRLAQWTLAIDQTVGSDKMKMQDGVDVEGILCSTIEGSLSFSLALSCGAVRLGHCSWVLPVQDEGVEQGNMLVDVNMRFVADKGDGTLYITTSVKPTRLAQLAGNVASDMLEVTLSPSGSKGRLLPEEYQSNVPAAFASTAWKAHVISALKGEGFELREPCEWVGVTMENAESRHFIWPAQLCFGSFSHLDGAAERSDDWKQYFDSATDTAGVSDALMDAEDFYNTSAQREQEMADARTWASKQDEDLPGAGADLTAGLDMTSPPLLHRPDLQAVGGVYPTPPDGLQPGHPLHQQIGSDSVPASQAQAENHQQTADTQDQADQEVTDATGEVRPRIPSIVSSVGAPPFQRHSSDDLFGDMDNIDFNGDEVGDADFSFFDEPDEVPVDENMPDAQPPVEGPVDTGGAEADMAEAEQLAAREPVVDVDTSEHRPSIAPNHAEDNANEELGHGAMDPETPLPAHQGQSAEHPSNEPAPTRLPSNATEEKPLSPFGIRERLLPPPIPASASHQSQNYESGRRRSSFGPLAFNTSLSIPTDRKYSTFEPTKEKDPVQAPSHAVSTQHKRKRSLERLEVDSDDGEAETTSSSGTDDSIFSQLDEEAGKPHASNGGIARKRTWEGNYVPQGPAGRGIASSARQDYSITEDASINTVPVLMELLGSSASSGHGTQLRISKRHSQSNASSTFDIGSPDAPNGKDLIMTAQIVAEQSVTCTESIVQELDVFGVPSASALDNDFASVDTTPWVHDDVKTLPASVATATTQTLTSLLPDLKPSDISSLALLKEANIPPRPPSTASKGQPRPPPPRPDPTTSGPDISPLNAPFIRVRRADDNMEMIPTAIDFWEALGLGPASGPKDIRHFLLVPDNEAVETATDDFLEALKIAYEGCKLGSHSEKAIVDGDEELDALDSTRIVTLDKDLTLEDAVKAYVHNCQALGEQLAQIAFTEGTVTTVVYIVNPFSGAEAKHHLCAAFWELCKTYRAGVARAQRSDKELQQRAPSDIVLQLLPLGLICAPGQMVIPTSAQMALLAREIYDRCPPTPVALSHTSPLPIPAALAVELAPPLAKRIGFQLAADAPVDLLHEASILHLAYAVSEDGQWLCAAWTDNTGRYQHSVSFCLRGRSFADQAAELWNRTMDILAARSVSWRVFITSSAALSMTEADCWRSVIRDGTERQQMLSVTLLRFHPSIDLQMTAPPTSDPAQQPGAGFLTPVSTPQAGGAMTVSPDATGQPATAPPTPAPSETAAAIAEQDPDAHLVDLEDETFSVLLDSAIGHSAFLSPSPDQATPLAYTAFIKRGSSSLPIAGTSLLWTLRVRPGKQGIDEGSARHAEMMLREVAGMFRSLGLLGKIRGVGEGLAPVHVVMARRAVEGLEGMVG